MIVNDPQTLAELTALFEAYEEALTRNDLDALDAFFWPSPQVLRFGAGESLYGIEAIRQFRANRRGGSPKRALITTTITTFGRDFGTANTEFARDGETRVGRQSQTWVRLPEGWRIVAAHVSLAAERS